MSKTKIEWADETWNPIVGCSKISEGCRNCYAEKMAARLATMPQTKDVYEQVISQGHMSQMVIGNSDDFAKTAKKLAGLKGWNGKTALNEKALGKKFPGKGKRIFIGSMGDMFHESVFFTDIDKVVRVILDNPQHIFMFLTKRPDKMRQYFKSLSHLYLGVIPNIWVGVTAENQEQANLRIPQLLQIPAAKRFVSVEPMLGPVDLEVPHDFICQCDGCKSMTGQLDWVICGGESGKNARPVHPEWVISLQDQCQQAGVPFFFKQWGAYMPIEVPQGKGKERFWNMKLVGKKKAGNLLDGKQYLEVPEI